MLNLSALGGVFGGEKSSKKTFKILDTSVIIDGRIADIAGDRVSGRGAGDSAVRAARTATGRGFGRFDEAQPRKARLDILQRIQKMAGTVSRADCGGGFPARARSRYEADRTGQGVRLQGGHQRFNLNKVAQLHGWMC